MQRQREEQDSSIRQLQKRFKASSNDEKKQIPTLPRQQELKKMNIDEFESRLSQVRLTRSLTCTEIEFVKNARRSLRKRIYASQSRLKRKEYKLCLEDTVFDLSEQIKAMEEEMHRLKVENMMLKTEKPKIPTAAAAATTAIPERIGLFYESPDMIWQDESLAIMPLDPLYHNEELMILSH